MNIFSVKEQEKTLGKELNKMEISNLPYKEVNITMIRMLTKLR